MTEDIFDEPAEPSDEKPAPKKPAPKKRGRPPKRRLSIKPSEIKVPPQEPTKFYLCGLTDACPIQTIHAAGIDFPKFVQKQEPRDDGGSGHDTILGKARYAGRIHELSDTQVSDVLEGIARKVIRYTARGAGLVSMDGSKRRPFVPAVGDEPLARYAYMIEVASPASAIRMYPPQFDTLLEE